MSLSKTFSAVRSTAAVGPPVASAIFTEPMMRPLSISTPGEMAKVSSAVEGALRRNAKKPLA